MTVFDGVLLIVVILCVIVGLRRGFVLTLCGLLSIVIALVGAKVAADQFSPTVTQAIAPRIETVIEAQLTESVGDTTQDALEGAENASDEELSGILGILQQSEAYRNAVSSIQDSIQSGISKALDLVAKLPVLHFFNRLLGGALGLMKGLLIAGCICCLILHLGLLPAGTIQESVFLRIFSGITTTSI